MKKRVVWLAAALAAVGFYAPAETVITSPTGLPDEHDAVLKSAVNAVKEVPADTVKAVSGAVSFTADELRNTAHGVKSVFAEPAPRATIRPEMLGEVTGGWDRGGEIMFRSYKISSAISKAMETKGVPQGAFLDVKAFFNGVQFPEGSSAYFQKEYEQLLIRNTQANLLQIENMLAQYHRGERDYKQVEIKAKFIEVSQSTLNQLGFTWRIEDVAGSTGVRLADTWQVNDNQDVLGGALRTAAGAFGGNPGAGSMVMTKTGWMPLRLAINALEQAGDSDVLSSPSLTTIDGKAADIWVGEDRAVPKSFEAKSADVNIHIEHKNWNSQLMGVHFSVTPEIQKDNMIRLKLNPQVVDLIGYDTYNVSPDASMMMINGASPDGQRASGTFPVLNLPAQGISKAWDQIVATDPTATATGIWRNSERSADHESFGVKLNAVNGQLPYFRVREIKTQVVVADGSTVGLGGLIYDRLETYKDKIPVLGSIPLLGRLFRSEGERSIKRNLMIFVSAGQIANNGQRKSDVALNQ